MKIAIASDHAGFAEKERLKRLLNQLGSRLKIWAPRQNDVMALET